MAKINLKTPITTIDGQIISNPAGGEATLGLICREALMSNISHQPGQPPQVTSVDEKLTRGKLATEMLGDSAIELKSEQIVLLKRLINETFNHNPHIVCSAVKALEA